MPSVSMRSIRIRAPSGSISEWRMPVARSRMRSGSRASSIAPPRESVSAVGAGSSALHTAAITARIRPGIVTGSGSEGAAFEADPEPFAEAADATGTSSTAMTRAQARARSVTVGMAGPRRTGNGRIAPKEEADGRNCIRLSSPGIAHRGRCPFLAVEGNPGECQGVPPWRAPFSGLIQGPKEGRGGRGKS